MFSLNSSKAQKTQFDPDTLFEANTAVWKISASVPNLKKLLFLARWKALL